jgi:hypothetical protein
MMTCTSLHTFDRYLVKRQKKRIGEQRAAQAEADEIAQASRAGKGREYSGSEHTGSSSEYSRSDSGSESEYDEEDELI